VHHIFVDRQGQADNCFAGHSQPATYYLPATYCVSGLLPGSGSCARQVVTFTQAIHRNQRGVR
jgi:hypothetical protein